MKNFTDYFSEIRPEKFFLVLAFFFGTLFLLLTPPFQAPDEPNHFYRAWQVSEGGFMAVKLDSRIGGYLPQSLAQVAEPFSSMTWNTGQKITDLPFGDLLKTPLHPEERKFYDFNNTALYSPVCYLPTSSAILVCRILDTSPLYTLYWARLTTLCFWILAVFYVIKIAPFYKWLFSFLALLPMSLFINMSVNADAVTNAISFLFIAAVLRSAYHTDSFSNSRFRKLLILIFLLTSIKPAYTPLLLLLLIIPKTRFKTTKEWLFKIGMLIFSGVLFSALWSVLLNALYLSYQNYNPGFRDQAALVNGADVQQQLDYILSHGSYLVIVLLSSVKGSFDMYFNGYIGMFGWLEKSLPLSVVVMTYLLIITVSFYEGGGFIRVYRWHKLIFLFTFLIILFLVFLSQHLIWDPVGGDLIQNIQGRYLIPAAPLACFLFYGRKEKAKKVAASVTMISTVILLAYCVHVLYVRYH